MLLDKYKLVIFDWDGTLSTSTPIARVARFAKIRYSLGDIEKKKQKYKVADIEDTPHVEQMNRFYAFVYDIYSKFYKPRLKEGVNELIADLRKKGKKIAVFSDSNEYRLKRETELLGVHDKVDIVLSAQSIGKFKPNPTGLVAIAKKLKVSKRDCVYVGDMAVDIYTARFAQIDSCSVANGVDPYWLLRQVRPKYIVKSLEALKKS